MFILETLVMYGVYILWKVASIPLNWKSRYNNMFGLGVMYLLTKTFFFNSCVSSEL